MDGHQQDLIAQFSSLTDANPSIAQNALESANWNLEQAVSLFYAQQEEGGDGVFDDDEPEDPIAPAPSGSTGAQPPAGRNAPNRPKQMTLRDLQRGDDDDDEEDDRNQDMFAGGEKSGLAVQNPDQSGPVDHYRNIMNQARHNRERPPGGGASDEEEPPSSTNFSGRAQTLGGDEAPSRVIQDPRSSSTPARQRLPRVTRTLHLWADGVSIDDGPLLRFDDPANEHVMSEINQGRAPKALLDVQPDQEVDLNLEPHKGENYVAPKKKYKPFGGQGQRLGSPTPGAGPSSAPAAAATSASTSSTTATPSSQPAKVDVDESQPTMQLQIRLGDGTRIVSRFNTTHTVGDIYDFVNRASPGSQQRAWALMTTFPSKELADKSQVLGEMSDFKRGGVVVQKWT